METELCAVAPADWQVKSVEDVCFRVTSGGTPSRKVPSYYTDGCWPWVKTQELQDEWIDNTGECITNEAVAASSAKVLPADTVLVAMYGATVGQLGILRRPMTCNQACCALIVDPSKADYRYLFFHLLHARSQLKSLATGAAQQNLSGVLIKSLRFPFPAVAEQRAIANILGTLDDKIELNRRLSETLEAMVRTLFKSWFVDFNPVRAKAKGRDPGLPQSIADLFPARLVDSELGEIPDSWEISSIGAVAKVIDCLHSKKPERHDSGLPLLQLANIRDDGLLDMRDSYLIDEADYRKWVSRMEASSGDCVITNVGRVGAVSQVPAGQKAALGRNMTGVRCRKDFPYPTVLIECFLSRTMKNEIALKVDSGTILDALNVRNIPRLRFVRGTDQVLNAFERACRPLRAKMEALLEESRMLAVLRDALLPKLISGERRIKDVDRFNGIVH